MIVYVTNHALGRLMNMRDNGGKNIERTTVIVYHEQNVGGNLAVVEVRLPDDPEPESKIVEKIVEVPAAEEINAG